MCLTICKSKLIAGALIFSLLNIENLIADDLSKKQTAREYRKIIRKNKKEEARSNMVEDLASGAAALFIGFYGYYFDKERGVPGKLVYSATQAGGIYLISESLKNSNNANLMILNDQSYDESKNLPKSDYMRNVVYVDRLKFVADNQQMAYTAGILCLNYGYSAYRERETKALQNVYSFLSFNFLLASLSGFYNLYFSGKATLPKLYSWESRSIKISVLPLPSASYVF